MLDGDVSNNINHILLYIYRNNNNNNNSHTTRFQKKIEMGKFLPEV